jgi:hypothetical protein
MYDARSSKKPISGLAALLVPLLFRLGGTLPLPPAAQGRQKIVHLTRLVHIHKQVRDGRQREVHHDGTRTEDDVAVAFPEHLGQVALAQDAAAAVTEASLRLLSCCLILCAAARLLLICAPAVADSFPALSPLGLASPERSLRRRLSGGEQSLLPEVQAAARPNHAQFLVNLTDPGDEFVCGPLRDAGGGCETIPGHLAAKAILLRALTLQYGHV